MKENSMSYRTAKQETKRLICEIEEMTITHRAYTAECLRRVLKENEELNKKIKEQKECAFREDGTEECLWYCSNCHDEWLFYEGTPEENNLKYCPHCGAKVIKYESYIETEIEIANKMAKDYLKESEE